MKMTILHRLVLCLVLYEQGVVTISRPIGPSFVSTVVTKQRLYYNNLGTRLDCSAIGTPTPVLTWFRTNGSDDRPSTFVQSSELIDIYENGSLFIRPFRDYSKAIHAGTYICRAENAAGSVQSTPVQLKPQIYDTYEIEVKNTFGFEQSSAILSCEISPPSASSYVHIIGWLERVNDQIIQLDLQPRTKYNLLSNKNLIIHNITKSDDNRTYACTVNNQIDNDIRQSRFKSLRVRDRSPFGPELSIPNNTEYRARAGDLIELPCGISSIPAHARISWSKNGMDMVNISGWIYDHSLIVQLSSTSSDDSGSYACRIEDESGGRIISVMSLKVDLPIQCRMSTQRTSVDAGSDVEFICTSNSIRSTSTHWQWYHNSKHLPSKDDGHYLIDNLTRNDMGMYQCCYMPSSSDQNACCAQSGLRVINSPPFILPDQQTHSNIIIIPSKDMSHVSIDLNLTLYADPTPTVNVYKDGRVLLLNNPISNLPSGDLFTHYRIHVSDLNDTGLYEYRINNSLGYVSFSKHLNIEKQKPFIQSISNRTILTGQQFTLACYASGQPNLHLQWIDQITKQVMNSSSVSPLVFTSTNTKSNVYTCQATNPYGESSMQVYVQIQIPARILSVTSNRTVKINETLDVSCSAEGDNQLELKLRTPTMKNASTIETNNEHKKTLSFTFEHFQMSDSGLYECSARNDYSEDRSMFEIIVQNRPDRIEKVFIENSKRIVWIEPFDGNAKILQYLLRMQYQQGMTWSNETIITLDSSHLPSYSIDNLYSKCSLAVTLEAINIIGTSLSSHPLHFQTNSQQLLIAPSNLTAVNISSNSVILSWQYPSIQLCNDSFLEYMIEIIDDRNQTIVQTHPHPSTVFVIRNLKSFTYYTLRAYASNELGASPKSSSLTIQTLESVPLAMIRDLTGVLLNSSSLRMTWMFEKKSFLDLNGKFRAFAVTIYENYNMSTLITIETINPHIILHNLHPSSLYHISVVICNDFDCGPSSSAVEVRTPSLDLNTPITIAHPNNKPILLDCPPPNSWSQRENVLQPYILKNNSLYIPPPEISDRYQCGSKEYHIQLYDKPSAIHAKLHYTTSNAIGLKIQYPLDIIESLTLMYRIKDHAITHEIHLSPPLLNIHLTNLSCGNLYEITIYAVNQVGFSSTQYLIGKTDGSAPLLNQSEDMIETISDHFIILNMSKWIINRCLILSYDIELFPIRNATDTALHRYFSFKSTQRTIQLDHLRSNEYYQIRIQVNTQFGPIIKKLSFQTMSLDLKSNMKTKNYYLITIIIVVSFLFTLILLIIVVILLKFCRLHLRKSDSFLGQTRKLKPVLCSSYPDHYQSTWLKSNNEFTIQNYTTRPYSYASEDSQGNINPYAVTGCTLNCKNHIDHGSSWQDNKPTHCLIDPIDLRPSTTPSERYFRPIILESSSLDNPESSKRNPLVQIPSTCPSANPYHPPPSSVLSTVSSSQGELFSAFTYVPSSSKPTTLNAKKLSNHNHMLADQSSSSADSGVHSSYTQSPIIKHSFRKCHFHGFSFDRPSSANANEDQDKHLYATYDQHFAFLRGTPSHHSNSESYRHQQQEQYSLV